MIGTALTLHPGGATFPTAHAASPTGTQQAEGPNLLVNGGFERGIDPGASFVFPSGDTSSMLQGWTLLSAGLDKFWPAVTYIGTSLPCQEGKYCIELVNGGENPKNIGGVKQTFATTVGQKYHLRFYQSADIRQGGPRVVKFTVAGQSSTYNYNPLPNEVQNPKAMRWIERDVLFTATAAKTTLEFDSVLAQNGYGSVLDNVQVHAMLQPTPGTTPGAGQTPTAASSPTSAQVAVTSVASGGRQSVQGTTRANAAVAVIIDYPDGSQLTASLKSDAQGHYSYTWATPAAMHGSVRVLVDGAGSVAQATFALT